jgi:hypothetical protein
MTWVLLVFLSGTLQEDMYYFSDLDTCLRIAQKIKSQNYDLSLSGDSRIWVKAYCVPKKVPKKE